MEKKKVSKKKVQPWLDALRSGKYKQGKGKLYNWDTDEYCCIGVYGRACLNSNMYGSYSEIAELFDPYHPFVKMNDEEGKTFEEIANFVEENYELV